MEIVGIKQLRENLSNYLAKVKSGERIIVTDKKKEIAVISRWGDETTEMKVSALIQKGVVEWAGGKPTGLRSRVSSKGGRVSDAVIEARR